VSSIKVKIFTLKLVVLSLQGDSFAASHSDEVEKTIEGDDSQDYHVVIVFCLIHGHNEAVPLHEE
jgi:hypothetical protein